MPLVLVFEVVTIRDGPRSVALLVPKATIPPPAERLIAPISSRAVPDAPGLRRTVPKPGRIIVEATVCTDVVLAEPVSDSMPDPMTSLLADGRKPAVVENV